MAPMAAEARGRVRGPGGAPDEGWVGRPGDAEPYLGSGGPGCLKAPGRIWGSLFQKPLTNVLTQSCISWKTKRPL